MLQILAARLSENIFFAFAFFPVVVFIFCLLTLSTVFVFVLKA